MTATRDENSSPDIFSAWNEGQPLGSKKIVWASKKLVTGPNSIMVAQKFCDIFFMKKRHQIDKQFSG
jgi:hypothetical protein